MSRGFRLTDPPDPFDPAGGPWQLPCEVLAPAPLRGLLAAFVFLTRLPMGHRGYRPADWSWASGWFPFVGIILGSMQAGVWIALDPHFAPSTLAVFVMALGLLATGAFHEDGLADTADALGGAYDRATLFTILKDSRLGTFGVAALVTVLLARVSLLTELAARAPLALILAAGLARVAPVWLMATLPYVSSQGAKSKPVVGAGVAQVVLATGWGGMLLAAAICWKTLPEWTSLALPSCLAALAAVCAWRFRVRAGGLTGDFLGALEQLGEVTVLGVLAVSL